MTNDVKQHLLHLFVIWSSSSLKRIFISLTFFLIGLFILLLLGVQRALYAVDTRLLLDMWHANISSQAV
jgi:hypothetical protein